MSTLKTHNLQSPDAGSVNIALAPNAGMVVTGISTFTGAIDANGDLDVDGHTELDNINISGVSTHVGLSQFQNTINLTHASAGQNYIYFNEDLQFAKNGTGTRVKIDSGGRVLIGETSVAGSAPLCVGNGGQELFEFTPGSSTYNGGLIEYIHRGDGTTRPDLNMYLGGPAAFKVYTSATERIRIGSAGQIGIGGANYGTSGQVLTSQGSGSAVQWASPSTSTDTTNGTANNNVYNSVATNITWSNGYNNSDNTLGNVIGCNQSNVYALDVYVMMVFNHGGGSYNYNSTHCYLSGYVYQNGENYLNKGVLTNASHFDMYYNFFGTCYTIPWNPSGTQSLKFYCTSAYNTNTNNYFNFYIKNKWTR